MFGVILKEKLSSSIWYKKFSANIISVSAKIEKLTAIFCPFARELLKKPRLDSL